MSESMQAPSYSRRIWLAFAVSRGKGWAAAKAEPVSAHRWRAGEHGKRVNTGRGASTGTGAWLGALGAGGRDDAWGGRVDAGRGASRRAWGGRVRRARQA